MDHRRRLAAASATLLVATNAIVLTVVFPHHRDSATHDHDHASAQRPLGRPQVSTRAAARPAAPRATAPSAAVRQVDRFAAQYARYRDRPLNRAGMHRLRATASLELAEILIAQPPLAAGGKARALRPVGAPRPRLVGAHALVIDTTLAEGRKRRRLRCMMVQQHGRWSVVGFEFGRASVGLSLATIGEG